MKKLLGILIVVALVFGIWWWFFKSKKHNDGPKQEALKVNRHSPDFNKSISAFVNEYINMKDAFVNADTAKIISAEKRFVTAIDSLKMDELKKDTSAIFQSAQSMIGDIKSNADAILKEKNITDMRQDFRMVSENLFPFLKTINYEGQKLYWQNCPMAFGEDKDANWISNSEEIMNPYLGLHHPEYKGTMVHCGETKDTIQ